MTKLRSSVEWLTKDWTFTRRMPSAFARTPIRVSTAGGLKYLFKPMSMVDPVLLRMVSELVEPGACVWDIGANVGLFAVAAAQLAGSAGKVVCFEADTWLVGLLRQTASMQPKTAAPIEVLPAAVSATNGVARFCVARRARASSHLQGFGLSEAGGVAEVQSVITLNLDSVLGSLPPPAVLKIDVEGAELGVLLGARELLLARRPAILCEVSAENSEAVARCLKDCGYQILDATLPRAERQPLARAVWSTLAVPADRPALIARFTAHA